MQSATPLATQVARYQEFMHAVNSGQNLTSPLLATVHLFGEDQLAACKQFLDFLATEPKPYDRETLRGHITGSALILDATRQHICLLHHAKLNKWLQPGGHSDGDSLTYNVALREAQEETGLQELSLFQKHGSEFVFPIDLDIHSIPERGAEPAHVHYDARYLVLFGLKASQSAIVTNHESHDVKWFRISDLLDNPPSLGLDASVYRLVQKAKYFAETKLLF